MIVRLSTNRVFVKQALQDALPDVETALWFAKALDFTPEERASLLRVLFGTSDVIAALTDEGGEHSTELQDYLVEQGFQPQLEAGEVAFNPDIPKGEILPEVWESLQIQIVDSIKEVVDALGSTVGGMKGKEGRLLVESMMKFNVRRPVFGDFLARIKHHSQVPNLWILDTSGSVGRESVRLLVDEVCAGAYAANAYLAIVSDTAHWWAPGEYDSEVVLAAAEFSGTHYEELAPLFDRDWGAVVTIADYDSSYSAMPAFQKVKGRVHEVFDLSLVNRPTFLSEVIGTVADKVTPVLIARNNSCVMYQ